MRDFRYVIGKSGRVKKCLKAEVRGVQLRNFKYQGFSLSIIKWAVEYVVRCCFCC